ncbi:Putative guanine nucleotide exchange factor MCF2L2 [Myotis davidii]|uniref:Putative guanine nucleotide exchange factor MCF2L2 n=1 Tax=Myotis davidii TaxID=225400 RepID=L5LLT9_MYODS|nr:Putative guanine nucleotide exchange factor MCF2L2 [Myotis davidii]
MVWSNWGQCHQRVGVAAVALVTPQEQGEVEKPSGEIGAGSRHSHSLTVLSDRSWHPEPAAGASGGSGTSSGCKWGQCQQQIRVPDEIMQQEIRPLLAVDIIEQLHRQFAILSDILIGLLLLGVNIIILSCPFAYSCLSLLIFMSILFLTITFLFLLLPSFFLCFVYLFVSLLLPMFLNSVPIRRCISSILCLLTTSFFSFKSLVVISELVSSAMSDMWGTTVAFPGNLQLIFILRPSRFIQRTITDIGIKYYQDEFKMKVPIVMLNSVSDLQGYIDKSQLTEDLGGTLEYRHSQWISHRTAIENFALTLKTTAQMLQTFGARLAATELPRGVPSTAELLMSHTKQRDKLQDELKLLGNQGATLLSCIQQPATKSPTRKLSPNQLENVATMERLLVQLDETEKAFSRFWSKHHLKLSQCLQLQHFEHNFCEVKLALDNLLAEQAEFTDIGNSVMRVERLLKEHKKLEGKGQASLEKAQLLATIGDQLIQSHHYAADSIRPKCVELRHLCDDFFNENKKKHDILEKSLELHSQLDKANAQKVLQKLGDVQEIFHKRQVSLMKLAARQTRPVQPVAPHPESSPKWVSPKTSQPSIVAPLQKTSAEPYAEKGLDSLVKEDDKTKYEGKNEEILECSHDGEQEQPDSPENLSPSRCLIRDLLETEEVYIKEMKSIIDGYITPMDYMWLKHLIPDVLQNNKDFLFGNIRELYEFHNRTFLKELEKCTENPELLARCFLKRKEDLQIYFKYHKNLPRAQAIWQECQDCAYFGGLLDFESPEDLEIDPGGIEGGAAKDGPKRTKDPAFLAELQQALAMIEELIQSCELAVDLAAVTGCPEDIGELGRLRRQGAFSVWTVHKERSKVTGFIRFKPSQRQLYLFERGIVFCKIRMEPSDQGPAPRYSFKKSMKWTTLSIHQLESGGNRKFELVDRNGLEKYILQRDPEFNMSLRHGNALTPNARALAEAVALKVAVDL